MKLGNGLGGQMLSCRYYFLGTQPPVDRFLSFYYGHPGFHINNILVILFIQVFIVTSMFFVSSNMTAVLICHCSGFPRNLE